MSLICGFSNDEYDGMYANTYQDVSSSKNSGWSKVNVPGKVETITSMITIDHSSTQHMSEHEIKKRVAQNLVDELMKSGFVEITKHPYDNPFVDMYEARLKIAHSGTTNCIVNVDRYIMNIDNEEHKFTQEEVDKAIRNTYPELFL